MTCQSCGRASEPGACVVETRGGRTLCGHCRERRERIATAVLAGLRAADTPESTLDRRDAIALAVLDADALMAALDATEQAS